jgi:GTP-binding protein YchF
VEHLGCVGLAGSGHDGLFRALTGLDVSGAADRVLGVVEVPDERLDALARTSSSRKVVPATFEIAYLPPLSPEAGTGLGSRLLGSLRNADALLVVVNAASGDPAAERDAITEELIVADLASVEARLAKQRRAAKGDRGLAAEIEALEAAEAALSDGVPIARSGLTADQRGLLAPVFLLTDSPSLVVVNVGVDQLGDPDVLTPFGSEAIAVCVEIEADPDVVGAPAAERAELLADLGVTESVVPRLARAALGLLGRRVFFTTGEKETRAWTFRAGATAPVCAGVIHSDLQRGFIRAEVIPWDELVEIGSWAKAKELGRVRVEGKDYRVADGDVLEIRFNV